MTDIIMKDVAENSVVMQLGQYHEMDGLQEKPFTFKQTAFQLIG